MSTLRTGVATCGAVLTLLGLFGATNPDRVRALLADAAELEPILAVEPGRPIVIGLGVLALTIGALTMYSRFDEVTPAESPSSDGDDVDVELAGAEIDSEFAAVARTATIQGVSPEQLERQRNRLREAVVCELSARGYERDEARRMVRTGTWTDDRLAAAFLGAEAPPVPLWFRVLEWFSAESAFHRRVRRTSAALSNLEDP